MKLFIALLQLITPLHIYAQQATGREISGTYAPGIFHNRNYVKNPGAEKNVLYITTSASIVTRTTSTPVMGTASYLIDGTSSGQTVKFDTETLDNNLKGQDCEARFTFSGDATLYKAYVEQGSTKITTDLTLTYPTYSKDVSIPFACGDLSSNSHLVIETTSASAAAIKVDDVYLGKIAALGPVSVDTEWASYTPTITGLGTVTIDGCYWRRKGDGMDIKCTITTGTVAASDFSMTLPTGYSIDSSKNPSTTNTSSHGLFWNINGTNASYFATANGGPFAVFSDTAVSTTLLYASKDTSSSRFDKSDGNALTTNTVRVRIDAFGIPISGWSSTSAIGPNNWNYGPTSFTPSTVGSQGFGTIAAESCFHQRSGKYMIINCKITAGTVAASEARITLPNSLTISSTEVPAIRILEGYWIRSTASATTVKRGVIIGNGGNAYINFSNDDYTGTVNPLVAQNGSAIFSNSDVISFYARIPITGWSENQNVPILVGSLTSSSTGADRYSYIELNYCGTNGTCPTPIKSTPDVSSVTRSSTGTFTINFAAGSYSSKPVCSYSANSQNVYGQFTSYSSNALTMVIRSIAASSGTDADGQVICVGPR